MIEAIYPALINYSNEIVKKSNEINADNSSKKQFDSFKTFIKYLIMK